MSFPAICPGQRLALIQALGFALIALGAYFVSQVQAR
jgi:hypothetical protein